MGAGNLPLRLWRKGQSYLLLTVHFGGRIFYNSILLEGLVVLDIGMHRKVCPANSPSEENIKD